ncbi:MAG: hypothetical protein K2X74_18715 [Acetobacteraceae bacterium]|nr:hypothetical protein [Acetobacteraceae bacterium]
MKSKQPAMRQDGAEQWAVWYHAAMTTKALAEAMKRVEAWPAHAQEELAAIALDLDEAMRAGPHHATPDELAGIDRGLAAARSGRLAQPGQVDAVFAKPRPA